MTEQLLSKYEDAVTEMIVYFLDKYMPAYKYDAACWVNRDIGGIYYICDELRSINFSNEVVTAIKHNIDKEVIESFYQYKSDGGKISLYHYNKYPELREL